MEERKKWGKWENQPKGIKTLGMERERKKPSSILALMESLHKGDVHAFNTVFHSSILVNIW